MRSSILQLGQQIRKQVVSPVELTRDSLERIEELNPRLNSFITVLAESALREARYAEQEIGRGHARGPLHGIPIGVKDIIDMAGIRTTAASAQYANHCPVEDSEVISRLRAAGAIILGKHNLHEFAYGGSSLISHFGAVRNPWNLERVTGGSSGGSAASVAAGLGFAAVGTDTAGSIRLPAAYCGLVGMKPTYGRVSARGVVPLSQSYDHVGPIANCVHDAALMLQVLAGHDPKDPTSADVAIPNYTGGLERFPEKLRIGVARDFFFENLDGAIATAVESTLVVFRRLGAEIREVKLEVSGDRTLSSAESWAFHKTMVERSPELYQEATLARIRSGANTTELEIERAKQELAESRMKIAEVFDAVDILLTPTTPILPPVIDELEKRPENLRPAELAMLRNTRPFNVWGIPAITLPCGFSSDMMPIGLQLAAAHWREDFLLRVAYGYEQATEWHRATPDVKLLFGAQPRARDDV